MGWIRPPHSGQGTRASEGPGRAATAMFSHAARRSGAMQSQRCGTAMILRGCGGVAKRDGRPTVGRMPAPVPPPRVSEHEVHVDGLDPRHDGVRIAQLSDIHVGNLTPVSHIRAAIASANAAAPDLIVLTGDYVCWRRHEVALAADQLGGLAAPRVLAVLGNHDYMVWGTGMKAALERNGYEVLQNTTTIAQVRGAPLAVVGVDDPVTRHDDLDASFAGAPARVTRVVLCHLADRGPALARRGADLVLSGHTHGGQIYVKGITDRIMKRIGLHYRRGMYEIGSPA